MPFSNGSATALGVKAHVLYSQLLKADEYWALLGLKSTTEIAAFLKQTAGYKDKFETLVPANVHRIDLENALRSSVLAEAESFLFYLLGVWRDFFLDWLSWYEAEQLKSIFRWIHSKRLDRDEMRRRLYHIPSSKLPYEALLNCRDYREVLEALVNTQYYAVLREPVRRLINGEKSLFALEFAIDNLVETKLYSDINKLPAHEREILEPLFGERLDLLNLYYFHRCVCYYNMSIEETISRMLPVKYKVKIKHLRQLSKGAGLEERIAMMEEMFPVYGRIFSNSLKEDDEELALDMSIERYIYLKALSILKSGVPGFHTAIAYFLLKAYEVADIIRVVEDVRYNYDRNVAIKYLIRPIFNGVNAHGSNENGRPDHDRASVRDGAGRPPDGPDGRLSAAAARPAHQRQVAALEADHRD